MADIVLINPRFRTSFWGMEHAMPVLWSRAIMPVAGLPVLAALTPDTHHVTIIDENVEEIDFERCARADIVGITGMIVQRQRMKEILTELKSRDVFTVVGGPWVTVSENYFGNLADVVVVGEAEETWPVFLKEWSEGRHARRYEQEDKTDMSTVPAPRLDLLKMNRYVFGSIQFSRGCPFTCEFCDIIVIFGRRPRIKTSAQIIVELEGLLAQGRHHVFIVDDNLIGNRKEISKVLVEVIAWQKAKGYPMNFSTEASLDLADDPELLQLMVEAGIDAVFVGIETPNEEALKETKKLQNMRAKGGTMLEKVHRIQNTGIEVLSGMIVGFDSDDAAIFDAQINFIRDARIVQAMVGMLSAIPKTPLYTRLEKDGRLDVSDPPEFGTNVIPLKLSRGDLHKGYLDVLREIFEPAQFFARLDALYLDGGMLPREARRRYLATRPFRRFAYNFRVVIETAVIVAGLARHAAGPEIRREYFSRLWQAMKRRGEPYLMQIYAMRCVMHLHAYQMTKQMLAQDEGATNWY